MTTSTWGGGTYVVGTSYTGSIITKYVVQGGNVVSRNDGQTHYISPHKLIKLYGVNPKECIIIPDKTGYLRQPGQIYLGPKYSGDYSIPSPTVATTTSTATNFTMSFAPSKPVKKEPSPRYLYKCGTCLREEKWTSIGINRHWRKCGR